jgi:tripartite-type tricarboxylate transporter receptor subunit TctC
MRVRQLAAFCLLWLAAFAAAAQFPLRPVRIISPFAAGGGSDVITRVIAQTISENTGKPVVVENKTGAGGRIGYDAGAKSAPDGYTLVVTDATYTMMPALYATLPWNHATDLVPVATMAQTPFVIMVSPGLDIATLPQLIEYARRNPGKINYGSAGNGSVNHVVTELFERQTGIELTHVPYKGMGEAVTGMLTGSIQLLIHSVAGGAPHINSGKAIGLAVMSAERSPALPNVPSAAEAGIPGLRAGNWFGLTAPRGTPREAIDWVNREVAKALASAAVKDRLLAQGAAPLVLTEAEFGRLIQDDTQRWSGIIRAAGIRAE